MDLSTRQSPRVAALVAGACACLLVASCGSQPRQQKPSREATAPANYYIGTRPIHAHLVQESGGSWVFKTVTESDTAPAKGYLVRLNDLSPAFDVRVAECEPQAYPANHKCNPAQPFRDKDMGVVKKIINGGIAAGTAGKVTGVSRTYQTAFDEASFNQAVDEALVNTGLGNERREFLLSIDRYAQLLSEGRAQLSRSRESALSTYRDTRQVVLDIRPRIAGLTEYYSSDIDFRDLVTLKPNDVDYGQATAFEAESLLPCEARRCASKARNVIAQLRDMLSQQSQQQHASISQQTAEYALECGSTSYAGYSFALECPETIPASGAATETVPVTMTILSRDFEVLYPTFTLADDNLSIEVEDNIVRFINQTNDYLSVTAQTVYYNSQVETQRQRIDIAPGVAVERPIDEFVTPAIRVESTFRDMTPDKARGTTFRFGFATSYRVAANRNENTLYDLREFNAGCVIENRVQPGSCVDSTSLADVEETEEREDAIDQYRVEEPPQYLPMPR